ncbi:MAG TPA: HAMP domain-containing sensor histidine kinase [Candidatus Limnocylindrales bacterium]|nr:HAMP domain-containing sensor histidine kinase [Candidatus Limnocylindrales bacterium]
MRGIRTRLALALVALVAVTVTAIGLGTYAFVDARLRDGLRAEAQRQANFNLSVLVPERLPGGVTRASYAASELQEAFRLRGDVETIVDFGDGQAPAVSRFSLAGALDGFPRALRELVDDGHLGYAWQRVAGAPSLIVGGRPTGGPAFYFVFPADAVETALDQLRIGLVAGALLAFALALATAGFVARGILRPVSSGSAAAARIAAGDLSARVAAGGADEFARFAAEFNRMADSLADTVGRLEASERRNRQFVADVSHELRTPLTALLGEAAIIESDLDRLQPDARRAAQLLVEDVRRLRALVEDLMEVSRFDAHAEQATFERLDLGAAVSSIVRARLPEAALTLPSTPLVVVADVRRLDRIVGNLLDNARQHAPGAAVEVELRGDADGAFVRVADRGPGVDPASLPHLFDRFFKADASRAAGSSGLGLAIAAEHAALLGGELTAANRDGGGLEVTLRLPVTASLPLRDARDTSGVDAGPAIDPGSASEAGPAPDPAPRREP